jgi:hypothetical protein
MAAHERPGTRRGIVALREFTRSEGIYRHVNRWSLANPWELRCEAWGVGRRSFVKHMLGPFIRGAFTGLTLARGVRKHLAGVLADG